MLPSVFLCFFFYGLVCYYASGAFVGRLIESSAQTMICSDVGPRHSALRLRSLGAPAAFPPEPISRCTIRGRMSGSPLPSQAPDFNCAFTTVLSQSLTRRNFSGGRGESKGRPGIKASSAHNGTGGPDQSISLLQASDPPTGNSQSCYSLKGKATFFLAGLISDSPRSEYLGGSEHSLRLELEFPCFVSRKSPLWHKPEKSVEIKILAMRRL